MKERRKFWRLGGCSVSGLYLAASMVHGMGFREALDVSLDLPDYKNEELAEAESTLARYFESATIDTLKEFLDSKQLLQQAARYAEDPAIISFLIDSGFDPNESFGRASEAGITPGPGPRDAPLHFAARFNPNPGVVTELIKRGADLHVAAGAWLKMPLHYAAAYNNPDVVLALIENGARIQAVNGEISTLYYRSPNLNGNTALHHAVFNKRTGVIDALVKAGAEMERRNSSGLTPLHRAIESGRKRSALALMRLGSSPNFAIGMAGKEGDIHDCTGCDSIHLLVKNKIDNEDFDFGEFFQILYGNPDVEPFFNNPVRILVSDPAWNGQITPMYEGYTPLQLAVEGEVGPDVVAALLRDGLTWITPEALHAVFEEYFTYSGKSAGGVRMRSVGSEENLMVLKLLLERGVYVNARDRCGLTLLHRAVHLTVSSPYKPNRRIKKAVAMLIKAGADVNTKRYIVDYPEAEECDNFAFSPLHEAAKWDKEDESYAIAKMLLDAGANRSVRNRSGMTAQDIVRSQRMKKLLDVEQVLTDSSK